MVEPEMAFCDLDGNVELATDFLKYLFAYVLNHCQEDMEFFRRFIDPTVVETLEKLVSQEFKRMTYTEAVQILTQAKETFEFPVSWGSDIQAEHERYLCEKVIGRAHRSHGLSQNDQALLHEGEQGRENGGGDGCSCAEDWRDYRRKPARGRLSDTFGENERDEH